jgi:hypothetical protein
MTVRWAARPQLRTPVFVGAFEGWNDAGDAASDAVRWLARTLNAREFATLDAEEYFDFQASARAAAASGATSCSASASNRT